MSMRVPPQEISSGVHHRHHPRMQGIRVVIEAANNAPALGTVDLYRASAGEVADID